MSNSNWNSNSDSNANSNSNSAGRQYQPFPRINGNKKYRIMSLIKNIQIQLNDNEDEHEKVTAKDFKERTQFLYDNYPGEDLGLGFKIKGVNNTGFRLGSYWIKWPTNSQLKQYRVGIQHPHGNWKEVELEKLPNEDPVSLNNFRNGSKAVKVTWKAGNKHHHAYFTPSTIAGLQTLYEMSRNNRESNTLVMEVMEKIRQRPSREKLFKNPLSRNKVRRGDIRFVILKKKSPSPAMRRKLAANAANKRAAASKTRGIPASKRKRSPNKSSQRTVKR